MRREYSIAYQHITTVFFRGHAAVRRRKERIGERQFIIEECLVYIRENNMRHTEIVSNIQNRHAT